MVAVTGAEYVKAPPEAWMEELSCGRREPTPWQLGYATTCASKDGALDDGAMMWIVDFFVTGGDGESRQSIWAVAAKSGLVAAAAVSDYASQRWIGDWTFRAASRPFPSGVGR